MAKKVQKEPTTVVYVGPSIVGVVKQNTIFNNGVPKALAAAVEETPAMAGLIVELEQLPQALKQLREKRGAIYTLSQCVGKKK